jgi:hypothetical protein
MRLGFVWIALAAVTAEGHDIITTAITFDREISRILYDRCASCHHENGSAFSLLTYSEARPWAVAIKEEILTRRMPPWGAVKGFGDFRDDQALTPEQMEVITSWVEGGVPEGEPKDLPAVPKFDKAPLAHLPQIGVASGTYTLKRPVMLGGLLPQSVPEKTSLRITATLPDGSIEPLLWLDNFKPQFAHPFLLRNPLSLPAGTVVKGVPATAKVALLAPVEHHH